MRRRDFLARAALGGASLAIVPLLRAQQQGNGAPTAAQSNLFDMNQGAARTVRRPPKPGARPSMTPDERDALEREIRCQCGCTLDVYICRTTDFSCQVSPAMHGDIMSLVEGGYSGQEIIDGFVQTYGERALMAPTRQGFNWAGYIVPFAALGAGALALTVVLRRMQMRPGLPQPAIASRDINVTATSDELAKLQAAIRRDE